MLTQEYSEVEIKMEEKKDKNIKEDLQSADEARKEFAKNSKEILDLAAKHNKRDLGNQAIGIKQCDGRI